MGLYYHSQSDVSHGALNPIQDRGSIEDGYVKSPCIGCEHEFEDKDGCIEKPGCRIRDHREPVFCVIPANRDNQIAGIRRNNIHREPLPESRICPTCQKEFKRGKLQYHEWKDRVYCSKTCSNRSRHRTTLNIPDHKKCPICGDPMWGAYGCYSHNSTLHYRYAKGVPPDVIYKKSIHGWSKHHAPYDWSKKRGDV